MEEVSIRFKLVGDEAFALKTLAHSEIRHPTDQVMFITLCALRARGLLPDDAQAENTQPRCHNGEA